MTAQAVMVALDAADLGLVRQYAASSAMPVMADLLTRGTYGRLGSIGRWLPGSVWPTFWTSTPPSEHGFHHYLAWSPARMAIVRPDPAMPGVVPFWRLLSRQGARVAAIDMPFAPSPDTGIELCGWSTLDSLEPARAYPPELLAEVQATFGAGVPRSEVYAQQTAAELLALRDEHVRIAESLASLAERLLRRDRFDLFTLCLPGPHRCGHRLWDDTGLKGATNATIRTQLADALAAAYRASDEALGRVLEAASADEVLVYTVHGMGPNTSRVEILDDMLTRVLGAPGGRSGGHAATARLRAVCPARRARSGEAAAADALAGPPDGLLAHGRAGLVDGAGGQPGRRSRRLCPPQPRRAGSRGHSVALGCRRGR